MNLKDKLYLIAATETILNDVGHTNLGIHTLEYQLQIANRSKKFHEGTDASLAILVRLRNNITQKIEWADIYYKPIIYNQSIAAPEVKHELKDALNTLFTDADIYKLYFIYKNENLRKMYATSDICDNYQFFQEMQNDHDKEHVTLGGKIPRDAKEGINFAYLQIKTQAEFFLENIHTRKR